MTQHVVAHDPPAPDVVRHVMVSLTCPAITASETDLLWALVAGLPPSDDGTAATPPTPR